MDILSIRRKSFLFEKRVLADNSTGSTAVVRSGVEPILKKPYFHQLHEAGWRDLLVGRINLV